MALHLTPLWRALCCGACSHAFTGNVRSVPQFGDRPVCPRCWARLNRMRAALGFGPWDTPADAYPGSDGIDPEDHRAATAGYALGV